MNKSYKTLHDELMTKRREIREINLSTKSGMDEYIKKRKEMVHITEDIKSVKKYPLC